MASAPRRRWSKELPPDLSDLMNKLIDYAASFIEGFDLRESEMRRIVREFKKISDEVRRMQKKTDAVRTVGAVIGAGGAAGAAGAAGAVFTLGLLAAPFTAGLSLVAAGAAAAAGGGAAVVVGANVTKRRKENKSVKKVEELGKEFMETVEPVKKILEEIKTTCEKLEQKKTEAQAGNTLTDMREFEMILTRVSELGRSSGEVLNVTVLVTEFVNNLIRLFVQVFSVRATPEEDQKLTESIIQSGDQCQKVFDNFAKMKKKLKSFRETKE